MVRASSPVPSTAGHAFDDDPGHPAGVEGGVVDQVGHHPLEAPLVDPEPEAVDARRPPRPGRAASGGRSPPAADEARRRGDRLHAPARAGSTSSSESSAEPASNREISSRSSTIRVKRRRSPSRRSSALCARGSSSPRWRLEHADGRRQGGERGAELVAHVRGEAGLALDPVLEVGGHPVEGRGQLLEVDVVTGLDPGVELATGDRDGGVGDVGQRTQRPAARPPPERGAGERGHQRGGGQGEGQVAQGAGELGRARRPRSRRSARRGAARRSPARACRRGEELRGRRARQDQRARSAAGWRSGRPRSRWRTTVRRRRAPTRSPGSVSTEPINWLTWVPGDAERVLDERGVGERLALHRRTAGR